VFDDTAASAASIIKNCLAAGLRPSRLAEFATRPHRATGNSGRQSFDFHVDDFVRENGPLPPRVRHFFDEQRADLFEVGLALAATA